MSKSAVDVRDPYVAIHMGPMKSGKTHLLALFAAKYGKMVNILVVKPKIDTTSDENEVSSRSGLTVPCVSVSELAELSSLEDFDRYQVIMIDECQFFPDLLKFVRLWRSTKIMILAGLDADSNQQKFGQLWDCIPYARKVKKLKALCEFCNNGNQAVATICIDFKETQVQIDDRKQSKYRSVCEYHISNRN